MFIAVVVFSVRVDEFLCTHFGPCLFNVLCNSRRHRLASKDGNFHLNVSVGITGIFELGWIIPHPSPVILPWPTPIIYREGTGGLITWLPVQIDRAVRPPHIRVSRERWGCVNSGAPCWLEFLLWNLCAVAQSAEALRYKPEGRGFDSWLCHWNFSLT